MSLPEFANAQQLESILLAKIRSSSTQKVSFAEFMALALYHPQYGYYTTQVEIGSRGDFFTSASLGSDFGELLAIQFTEMWHNLGCPNPFYLVEMGAGNGELARDIWLYFRANGESALKDALNYLIIERSPYLIAQQQELLKPLGDFTVRWQDWNDIAPESIEGCFFSNELVDAFPVHLIEKQQELQEIYLTIQNDALTEVSDRLSNDRLREYFQTLEIDLLQSQYASGYRTEVNLAALDWLESVASKLKRGYLLTIDYGYSAEKYYRPARSQGTLQCYYQHRRHNNPYANLGYQDLTAHVNFTALERYGELYQLERVGFTQQGLFLMALGLGDRLNELSNGNFNPIEIFQRRDALHQLISPTGLGGFGVLAQSKNLDNPLSLRGFTMPTMQF
ncbi:MAG: class I SAM-dependent methyltransferase [Cyanobacteria bacterium J06623_7]